MTARRGVRALLLLTVVCGGAASASAQDAPFVSLRVFGEASAERFAAVHSFDATFGQSIQPFYGGGVEATFRDRVFVDIGASTFSKNGDQVFVSNGQVFHLGIPTSVTITPIELAAGYRFHVRRLAWLVPYAGAGAAWYSYKQSSMFAQPSDNIDTRKAGLVAMAGAEFRLQRWVGVAADAEYAHVPGILGAAPSVSNAFGENDLGGIAGRIRIIVGK
ncbi:MAG TPA: outer membrane beta-barrel protein [Vicinamibacterales bacterium]|nr:outer membrane beta-barrel protein [Vicinamibacterales bacterium]